MFTGTSGMSDMELAVKLSVIDQATPVLQRAKTMIGSYGKTTDTMSKSAVTGWRGQRKEITDILGPLKTLNRQPPLPNVRPHRPRPSNVAATPLVTQYKQLLRHVGEHSELTVQRCVNWGA